MLTEAAARLGAGMIVVGGKHHSALGRWLGGSTSHNMVRAATVPVLITAGEPQVTRVLVAVDVSPAAKLDAIAIVEEAAARPWFPPIMLRELAARGIRLISNSRRNAAPRSAADSE